MQNIFPELSNFAFEFKYEDGHDYFHIFTIRDTDHSCWNWVSKPVKESICLKIALSLIIHLKHSLVLRLLHSRLCERKQKCWIRKCRRCQKCLFQKQATDSSNGVADPALHCGILTNALQVLAFSRKCDFSIGKGTMQRIVSRQPLSSLYFKIPKDSVMLPCTVFANKFAALFAKAKDH